MLETATPTPILARKNSKLPSAAARAEGRRLEIATSASDIAVPAAKETPLARRAFTSLGATPVETSLNEREVRIAEGKVGEVVSKLVEHDCYR